MPWDTIFYFLILFHLFGVPILANINLIENRKQSDWNKQPNWFADIESVKEANGGVYCKLFTLFSAIVTIRVFKVSIPINRPIIWQLLVAGIHLKRQRIPCEGNFIRMVIKRAPKWLIYWVFQYLKILFHFNLLLPIYSTFQLLFIKLRCNLSLCHILVSIFLLVYRIRYFG